MARAGGKDRGLVEKPRGSGKWYVRIFVGSREKLYKAPTKTAAGDLYRKLKTEILERRYFPDRYKRGVPLSEWMARCQEGNTNRDRTRAGYFLKEWGRLLGDQEISQITTEDLRQIQAKMIAGTRSTKTVNRYFAFLRRTLNLAVRDNLLARSPMAGIRFFAEENATRFFDDDELRRIRELLSPADWKLAHFAIETMLRRGEQFLLKWAQVNLESGMLTIPRSKSGKTRHVPLSTEAAASLRSLDSFLVSPWVFPSRVDPLTPRHADSFVADVFMPALRKLGIRDARWHTLRHTGASRRIMAGVDLVTLKELMGHSTILTTMRYSHLLPGHVRESVNKGSLESNREKTGSWPHGYHGAAAMEYTQPLECLVPGAGIEPARPFRATGF